MLQWKITKEYNGMIIRDYLQNVHSFSRRMIKAIKFDGGEMLVNGNIQHVHYRLIEGDILSVQLPPERIGPSMTAEDVPLSIMYEDEAIIVLDKPPGTATIPSRHHLHKTIANGLLAYYKKHQLPFTVHVVTRLDRDTSGLLLVAKHRYCHSLLDRAIQNKKIERKYTAIVEGHLIEKQGCIDAPIGRKEGSIIERQVRNDGQKAITHYQIRKEYANQSLVDIELETGRTHQIRVHFSSIGHPLVGDDLYGGSVNTLTRQALHCSELRVEHPFTKETITFQSPLPKDMRDHIRLIQH
ncbi:RluA family pseudouridine synthase [Virgibacillus sp. W0181]|uniref:RluA family pseudouridine synthase n=1 Tax=Virgibacillus sp. W0181 TaxID=3391581 RepID=UPI003F45A8DB